MSEEVTLDDFGEAENDATQEPQVSRFWGEVPEGWQLVDGSEVYEVNPNPKSDEEPSTYIEMDALDTELPYPQYFGQRNASEYSGKTFTTGDTLFARITPCTENGKAALVPEMDTEIGIGSTEYAVLSPKRDRLNPWLLYYLSKSYPVHNYAVSRMRGSTGRQRVPFSVFRRELDIALPPLSEQRKIATVLYTVDQAIEKTEEIVNKSKQIATETAQNIAISGIGHSEFEEIRLGPKKVRVPVEWDVSTFGDLSDVQQGLQIAKAKRYRENAENRHQYITVQYLNDPQDPSNNWYIENPRDTVICESEDILMTRTGNTGEVITGVEGAFHNNFFKIEFDRNVLLRDYLVHYLESKVVQDVLISYAGTTTIPDLNHGEFFNIPVLLPPISEQREISQIIGSLNEKVTHEEEYLSRLQRLKRGLMQDLLSGAIRTTDTTIQVPEEVTQYG